MILRTYFSLPDDVKKTLLEKVAKTGSTYVDYKGCSIRYESGKDIFYMDRYDSEYLGEIGKSIFEEHVCEFSLTDSFEQVSNREIGVYEFQTARAVLEHYRDNKGVPKLSLIAVSKTNAEDILELRAKIKDGSLRPTKSYENPQKGLSSKDLWLQNENLVKKVNELSEELCNVKKEREHLKGLLKEEKSKTFFGLVLKKMSKWCFNFFPKSEKDNETHLLDEAKEQKIENPVAEEEKQQPEK